MRIALTQPEIDHATRVGKARQQMNIAKGLSDAHGFSGNGEQIHIQGAIGEKAIAKAFNLPWVEVADDFKNIEADVGAGVLQVRSTPLETGRLILRPRDNVTQLWILCRLHLLPIVLAMGWILGAEGKQPEYLQPAFRDRPACWFVPLDVLKPMELLHHANRAGLL